MPATRWSRRAPYPIAARGRTILDDLTTRNPKARPAKAEDLIEPHLGKELDDAGVIRLMEARR
jgi:hypothetical protein